LKAAIYIRVSTDDQAREGFSIPAQRDRLSAYVNSQEWEIYDYFVDDGYSAKDTKRPAFQRMMKDAEERKFDLILVHKLDRFTRNVRDLYDILEKLHRFNVSFRSSQEQFDTTTTMGRAMIGMLGIFAQWERETIADRVYWGMEQKIISGQRNGAQAPMGYDLVEGLLVPNGDAEFIQRLFMMYLSGYGMPTINGILAKENKSLHIKTLWYILKNPIYCGEYRWNFRSKGIRTHKEIVVQGDIIPIISKDDFYRAQSLMKTREKKGRAATSEYLFSGIVKCARCGYPMNGGIRHNKNESILFYRCGGRVQYGKCDMPRIREEAIEEALLAEMRQTKKELAKRVQVEEKPNAKKDVAKITKEMEQIKKRKEKWRLAFANELISMEELRNYTDKEKQREAELQSELGDLRRSADTFLSVDELHKLFQDITVAWKKIGNTQAKKMFLNHIFGEIVIDTETVKPRSGRNSEYGCFITSWKLVE
jgi:site-specific DNA recombinase